MRWIPGTSRGNVEDKRGMRMMGMGGGGFGRLGIGGILVILVLSLIFKKDFFSILSGANGQTAVPGEAATTPAEDTLADFITFVLNDAQSVWAQVLPAQSNASYQDARLVLFRDAVGSACGTGQAASGPFYCPPDQRVYIDLGFYQELDSKFGASGDFAQAYVLAHEIGHHVQNLTGRMQGSRGNDESVRIELQADCYAGIWAGTARDRRILDPGDIEEGLRAAASVGDDRIQQMSGRAVNPESWTHGSAAQRSQWFRRGFDTGRMDQCQP